MLREIHCSVEGRVQLVMYRDFTQRNASKLGIVGTVQNLNDGTVEVVAQGTEEALKQLVVLLNKGSILASVKKVNVEWRSPSKSFNKFRILYE